ncbi:MAG: hypothetical protein GEU73_12120 [Chloroflexi bacterium]|nr:hypothetical protein [Chloroflexota bacterium]
MQPAQQPTVVRARTTDIFGRCALAAGQDRFFVDHPATQEGPGEYAGTIDHFLTGVAACGVLMLEYQARLRGIPLHRLEVAAEGVRGEPGARVEGRSLFERAAVHFEFVGPTDEQARVLVEHYQRY